jgi:outer membrane receptor protein involved in Fe transport
MHRWLLLLVFLFGIALPVTAQSAIEATVRAADGGAPLEDIVVHLTNEAIGLALSAETDAQGRVRFPGLATAGTYTVSAGGGETGLTETAVGGIRLRTNETRGVLLVVPTEMRVELGEVAVAGRGYAEVEATSAEVAATLRPAEVRALPVEGRDLAQTLYRLPGVVQSTGFYPEAPNVSINGASGLLTSYLVDGLDNTENFLGGQKFPIPVGAVQDVTVLTSTYSAEFGRTSNGIVNVTTRSGQNEPTGEAFYVTRPGSVLDASSPFAQRDLSGNLVKDGFQRHQFGASVGGPIARDRTFFFANVEQTFDLKDNLLNAGALGVNATVPGENRFTLATARIDHTWSPSVRSALRVNVGNVELERQGGGLEGGLEFPSAASTQERRSALVALTTTALVGGWVYEGGLQYARFGWDYASAETGTRVNVLGPDGQFVAGLGNPGFTFDETENVFQLQQKLTTTRGAHTLRVGADVLTSDFSLAGGGPQEGAYTVQLTQDQLDGLRARNLGLDLGADDLPSDVEVIGYSVELRPGTYGARQTTLGLYAEDQIAVTDRVTATLGLRYDFDTLSKGGSDSYDLNNVAPRLGLAIRLDERTALRGGYGLFYDKVLYAVYSDALQQNSTAAGFRDQIDQLVDLGLLPADTDLDRVTFDGNLTVDATDLTPGFLQGPTAAEVQDRRDEAFAGERRILNPNGYDNPYSHQFSLGVQRELGRGSLLSLDLVHVRGENLFRLRHLNAPSAYAIDPNNVVVRSTDEADATRPVAFRDAEGAVIPGAARSIVVSETEGQSRYYAATLGLLTDRAPAFGTGLDVALRLNYTLSSLRNDTDDINFRAQDANDFEAEWGPSVNDRRHVISGVLYTYPVRRATVTVAGLVQSGQPINRVPDASVYGTTDLNGNGDNRDFSSQYTGGTDREPGETRNSDRLPWSSQIDLGVAYAVPAGGLAVELRADVFNVFNATNLSGYANNATVSNQIQVGPAGSGIAERNAGPPRQFQFTARLLF